MKLYSSFLVRCWVMQEEAEKTIFDIEHIQKGDHLRATSPAEAMDWMLAACRAQQPAELLTEGEEENVVPDHA